MPPVTDFRLHIVDSWNPASIVGGVTYKCLGITKDYFLLSNTHIVPYFPELSECYYIIIYYFGREVDI